MIMRAGQALGLLLAMVGAATASAAEFRSVRYWDASDHTRVVFDISAPIQYKLFVLESPHRVVLDVPAASAASLGLPNSTGVVRGVRTGRQGKNLRLVLDLERAVQPKTFLLAPAGEHGHRLVLDLFEQESRPAVVKTEAQLRPSGERKVIVAIDAGHGGEDPGALGAAGSREKDITLAVAKSLAAEINAHAGMSAVLIRDGDFFIPLEKRYALAREAKADLFVSIHADAFTNKAARGSSVFVLSQRGASSEAARMLARQENQADLVGGVSLGDKDSMLAAVLLDLSQGATMGASEVVASNVLRGRNPSHSMRAAEARKSKPWPSGAATPARNWRRPKLPTSAAASNWRSRAGALTKAITPPELLPYSTENGPRSTSMRCAPARSKWLTWPWPSGMVAGMPSVYRRRPRTPKPVRAPKPRALTCKSCA